MATKAKRMTPRLMRWAGRVQTAAEAQGFTLRTGREKFTLYGGDLGPQGFTPDHDPLGKITRYLEIGR